MSGNNGLSPPGTATYSSNTLHVGDGTWDNGRDDFLLPNLVGLNFDTMRYNGMGNRFRGLPEYHSLILGHGVLAAITFLGILPLAIFTARFGLFQNAKSRSSVKLHVYCQILVLLLSTVILVLGWFAVGPERSLTNPHHGIGVAIYVLIWVQFLYGWFVRRLERNKDDSRPTVSLKAWCHKLLGRSIALLGGIQIALGLTLYGSPKYLFILYALTAAFLLTLYLCLVRVQFTEAVDRIYSGAGGYQSDYDSYYSGSRTQLTGDSRRRPPRRDDRQQDRHHWGRDLLAAGGVIGAYEAFKHRRMRKREEREQSEIDAERRRSHPGGSSYGPSTMMSNSRPGDRPSSAGVTFGDGGRPGDRRRPSSRRPPGTETLSDESWDNEKPSRQHTWRDRILGVAGAAAAFEGARRLFGRKDKESTNVDDYRPPLGGNHSFVSQTDVSRVQQGQAPFSPETPGGRVRPDPSTMTPSRPSRRARMSGDSMTDDEMDSFVSPRPQNREENHTLRDSIAMFGALAGFREWNKQRRERREHARADRIRRQELQDEESFHRRTSNNYPHAHQANRRQSFSETNMTGVSQPADPGVMQSDLDQSRPDVFGQSGLDTTHPPLPANAGSIAAPYGSRPPTEGAAPSPPVPPHSTLYPERMPEGYQIPPPPPGPPPGMGRPTNYQPPIPGSAQMPTGAINPDPSRLMSRENVAAGGAAALGGAALAAGALSDRHDQSESPSRFRPRQDRRGSFYTSGSQGYPMPPVPGRAENAGSPPVSLKMRVHNDGRHVTLRRLKDEEIAAEQAAQRQERRQRQQRPSSASSAAGDDSYGGSPRYRRGGPIRQSSEQPIRNVPAPPPMSSSAGLRSDMTLPVPPPLAASPSHQRLSPNAPPASANAAAGIGSGLSGVFGSPGDAGTGTDVSAFADNRRRRRAERARRLEAARGTGNSPRVEFE